MMCIVLDIWMKYHLLFLLLGKTVASATNKCSPSFAAVRKFEQDFWPSDMPCATPSATTLTDESVDRSQSEFDQPVSECPSEAEGSDTGGQKLSQRKLSKLKSDMIPAAATDTER